MDWLDKLKQYAPDIALAIATGGTSALATTATRILAKELTGDEGGTLDQLKPAIENATPTMLQNLTRANNDYLLEQSRIENKRLGIINQTMQVEANSENSWASKWRPFWGFVSAISFGIISISIAIAFAILAYKDPAEAIKTLPTFITSLAALFSIPGAILGVSAWHRGKEKRIKAGERDYAEALAEVLKQ